jgi:hypothetical protein
MTARTAAVLVSGVLALAAAACTNFYEIPIETPIKPKLDVTPFQRVHVVGFIAGGSDDVDANLETVRLLRSQLRTRSNLRVIEADVLPLAEIAQEQAREALAQHGVPGSPVTPTGADPTSTIVAMPMTPQTPTNNTPANNASANNTPPNGPGAASAQEKAATSSSSGSSNGAASTGAGTTGAGTTGAQTPPAGTTGTNGEGKQQPPATTPTTPAAPGTPAAGSPAASAEALAARIKDEKDLAAYERIFANTAYWKKLGEEFQQPLIVTGTVLFTPQQKSGIVTQQREVYDQLGRRVPMMQRVYQERKGYVLRPKFVFIDGRTGATIYSESFREERLYPAAQNTPALSSYFEMMDTLIPSFLNTLSTQKVRGTRVLLR